MIAIYICINEKCELALNGKFQISRFSGGEKINIVAQMNLEIPQKSITINVIEDDNQSNLFAQLNQKKLRTVKTMTEWL